MFRTGLAPRVRLMGWGTALLAVALTLAAACGSSTSNADKTATAVAKGGKTTVAGSPTAAKTSAASPAASAAAGGITGTITIPSGASIKIGVSASLTGDTANLGIDIRDGAALAGSEVATVKVHNVEIDGQDDGCATADTTVSVANRFVADKSVVAVVGPMCSNGAKSANPIYESAGLIHISASATAPELTEQGLKTFFRTAWRDDLQGKVQATYALQKLSAKKAYVVDDTEAYGAALADQFVTNFQSGGGTVDKHEKIQKGDTDFSGLATRIESDKPDVLVFEGFVPEGTLLLKQARDAGFTGKFMGPDGVNDTKDFIQAGGAATDGAIITGGPQLADTFLSAFKAKFGRDVGTAFTGHAYDATKILLAAIDKVAVQNSDGSLTIDKAKFLQAIHDTDYTGVTGHVKFDAKGDRVGTTASEVGLALYIVQNGAFVPAQQ